MKRFFVLFLCVAFSTVVAGCGDQAAARKKAESQVNRLADELDRQTNDAGIYQRVKDGDIQEFDPWGIRLQVAYSQGGVAEVVKVTSAGPDQNFGTDDDIATQRMSANLKGIGTAVKDNAEETAAKAAKGLVKGGLDGLKESVRDAMKKKPD